MSSKKIPLKNELNSVRRECSAASVSERIFERTLNFAEIAQLCEKCALWDIGKNADKTLKRPLTFVIPATQLFASVSRRVE